MAKSPDDQVANSTDTLSESATCQQLAEAVQVAWQQGDTKQSHMYFEELWEATDSWLLGIAHAGAPRDMAKDLVARTYCEFLEALMDDAPIRNARGLLRTILNRRIIDTYRARPDVQVMSLSSEDSLRHDELLDGTADAALEAVEAQETIRSVSNEILDALRVEDREVLSARYLLGLSVEETQKRLNLTRDQVKKRTLRAVEHARQIALERGLLHDLP